MRKVWWFPIVTALVAILTLTVQVNGTGVFEVRITDYKNPKGHDYTGRCCSGRQDTSNCKGKCYTFFRLCLTHVSREHRSRKDQLLRLDANTPCTLGMTYTELVADRQLFPEKTPLHLNITFSDPWPGKFLLLIEAWHSSTGLLPDSDDGRLIIRFTSKQELAIGSDWTNMTLSSDGKELSYSFHVSCSPGFTPPTCDQRCDSPNARFLCMPSEEENATICQNGWTGDQCDIPVCHESCHSAHGYCHQPGECICRLGWTGDFCDQCLRLPGCRHGSCRKPFECICEDGWDGFFCNRPICKQGCHLTRGYCDNPGECSCRFGWKGPLCNECQVLPGCVHGNCSRPLECNCYPGWKGIFCNIPICHNECHPENGYCTKPNECRCRVGWYGKYCEKCFPYPGCKHGFCNKPWECNCDQGWGGMLCDEKLDFCLKQNPCQNGGKCISKTADEGYYECTCKAGFSGKNCETMEVIKEEI